MHRGISSDLTTFLTGFSGICLPTQTNGSRGSSCQVLRESEDKERITELTPRYIVVGSTDSAKAGRPTTIAGGNCNILFAIDSKGARRGMNTGPSIKAPKFFPVVAVECLNVSILLPGKNQPP